MAVAAVAAAEAVAEAEAEARPSKATEAKMVCRVLARPTPALRGLCLGVRSGARSLRCMFDLAQCYAAAVRLALLALVTSSPPLHSLVRRLSSSSCRRGSGSWTRLCPGSGLNPKTWVLVLVWVWVMLAYLFM